MRDGVGSAPTSTCPGRGPGAGDHHPPPVRPPDARHGHGGDRLVLRPQGLRLRRPGRARQVLVRRRRSTPASARSRTATTPSTGRSSADWCDGRVGLWGESYYGFTSLAAAISGHPAVRVHRARRHRRRPAGVVVPAGRAAAEHHRLLGDRDGRRRSMPTCRGVDAWHLPLTGMADGGRRRRRVLPGHDRPRERRRLVARARASATGSPRCACRCSRWGGWYDNYIGRAAARPRADAGDAPRAGDRAPAGRPVGPRGQRRAHRPRRLRAAAAAPRSTAGTPTRRSSTATCWRGQRLRPPTGDGRGVHARPQRLAATRRPGRRPAAAPTPVHLRAGGVAVARRHRRPTSRRTAFTYDPADPVAETVGGNCWALCDGARRPPGARAAADILPYVDRAARATTSS